MRCSNMAAEFKKGEKPGRYPSRYTDSFTAKNTCTDNYGALYCKVRIYFETGFCVGSRDRGRSIGRLWVSTRSFVGRSNITLRTLLVSL